MLHYRTRKGKLKEKLLIELDKPEINLDNLLKVIDDYEKNNIQTINKLQRKKMKEMNRIHGALKQCIHAHGPITMNFISSAGKRIYGAMLEEPKDNIWNKIMKFLKLKK